MNCPKCNHAETKVTDTRIGKNSSAIRRRRQCLACDYRFSTLEEIIREGLVVIKRDGRRQDFDRNKILLGIQTATEKCPIDRNQLEELVSEIVETITRHNDTQVTSKAIGEEIMKRLKSIDQIAYVRFASVYKDFRDISEMAKEISSLTPSPE